MMDYRIALFALLLCCAAPLLADGMMIPARPQQPNFSVPYHRVRVTIDRQVATTDIDQAFHSNAAVPIEGTYIFPLADGMSLSKFTMRSNNEDLPHRVLEKEEARRIYNGIVASRRDPALLEWLGTRMIRASVFPIQPGEDKPVHIAYQEVLAAQNGAVKYVYPLKTEKLSARPLAECRVEVTIRSAQPIRSVYSPTHNVVVTRRGEYEATAVYADKNVLPDQDLVLYYTVSEADLGMNLLTYRDPARGDGYFLLLAAPKTELKRDEIQPKDIIFVLDTSGSMAADGKLKQAKEALKYCLNSLDPRDRFAVIAFNQELRPWQATLQRASDEHVRAAEAFFDEIPAAGNTHIDGALKRALALLAAGSNNDTPRSVFFLTDGLPTEGETNVDRILGNVRATNPGARIFAFGVGYDYNAHFLDRLANDAHGIAENVLPRESLEGKISDLYAKVSTPLLMNLALDWGGVRVTDLYPGELPDLFRGSQLLVAGRYAPREDAGSVPLTLTGWIAGRKQTYTTRAAFPTVAMTDDFIPRLWATRKIGYLEDRLRLQGADPRVLEEVIRLSKEYGILTEYTSFLVDMDVTAAGAPMANVLTQSAARLAERAMDSLNNFRAQTSNNSAVTQSLNRKGNMYAAQAAPGGGSVIINSAGERQQLSQLKNVSQRSFVQNGTQWIDVNYRTTQRLVAVKAFSPAYFQLANAHPQMARYLSVSNNVRVALKETAIQVEDDGQEAEFAPEELRRMEAEMTAEFGRAPAPGTAMIVPTGRGLPGWLWPVALALAIPAPVVLWRRRRTAA